MTTRTLSTRMPRADRGLLRRLLHLIDLRASRIRLGQLDPHLLRDIGIAPDQAMAEAEKPFWDAPDRWLR